jgi:hypothetical protein
MAIGFPASAGDSSFLGGTTTTLTLTPPANVANGDLLIAVATARFGVPSASPSGWTTLVSSYTTSGGTGQAVVQYFPVPVASALPANWTWTWTTTRQSVTIIRVTGVNLSGPFGGQATSLNAAGNASLPVGSVASGGAGFVAAFSYFNEFDLAVPASPFGTSSWPVISNEGLTGANRSAVVIAGGSDNGSGATAAFTVDITTQWPLGSTSDQAAAAVAGLEAAGGGTPHTATASLAVAPSFTASRTAGRNRAASLAVSPSLSASRSQGHVRTGTLAVQPSLSAARTRGAYRSASLLASPGFTASRTLGHARQAGLLIQPGFTATRSQGHARTGLLALSPGLAAVTSHGHARSGSLLVSPSFRAVPSGGSALPILVSLGRARWLWALGMARNSEGASMTSLSQAAISTQPVQVQVTVITETGEPYNPTGDPVSVAFVPQAYPPASPQDGDWITASWATDTAGNYWATALVGPANGGTALAAGSYVAWVRVTGNPAVPEEPGPVLLIF